MPIGNDIRKLLKHVPFAVALKRRFEPASMSCESRPYKDFAEQINSFCGPLAGKRILEAGCAPVPDLLAEFDRSFPLKEAVGINLIIEETKAFSSNLRVQYGDLRKMEFPDNYFDLIVSSSVFEHIHDFDIALAEMNRVLKPGGFVYSHFGPIWSGSYGHHLWYQIGSRAITYHTLVLPPYCHLLMTENELRDWLEQKGEDEADEVAKYVFRSKDQNQMMFSDYERAVSESAFEQIVLKGYDNPALQSVYAKSVTVDCLSQLNKKYPNDANLFLYDGITMLLRKSSD